jgi:hypothetical protein
VQGPGFECRVQDSSVWGPGFECVGSRIRVCGVQDSSV